MANVVVGLVLVVLLMSLMAGWCLWLVLGRPSLLSVLVALLSVNIRYCCFLEFILGF